MDIQGQDIEFIGNPATQGQSFQMLGNPAPQGQDFQIIGNPGANPGANPAADSAGAAGAAGSATTDAKKAARQVMRGGFRGAMDGITSGGPAGLAGMTPMGAVGNFATGAINVADKALMGDKNFGAQSEAIDQAVHGASKALMKSGNPIAMGAAVALEGANFLTKATGQNVQGFDVDINSSGYSANMGHMASKANRDFLGAIGLGGLNTSKADAQLKKRNEQAMMALKAANVADTTKFEQEARLNSVDNVIRNNEMALAGGLDTSMLTQ